MGFISLEALIINKATSQIVPEEADAHPISFHHVAGVETESQLVRVNDKAFPWEPSIAGHMTRVDWRHRLIWNEIFPRRPL